MRFNRLIIFPVIIVSLVLLGTMGFMYVEKWDVLDSLYMSLITLTTIGYSEPQTLSRSGRIFNIFYIIGGLTTFTLMIRSFIAEVANIDFNKRRQDRMKSKIKRLKHHTIICGYGRMGEIICQQLHKQGNKFVVIEKRENLIAELQKKGFLYIEGDASNEDPIIDAGVDKARVLVSAVDNDSDGLYIALAARSMNPNLYIIVRASEEASRKRILRAGADKVVLPFVMSGHKVAEFVLNPAVEDLFDLTGMKEERSEDHIQLADLFVSAESKLVGMSLKEIGPELEGLIIVGVRNQENAFNFKPSKNYRFCIDDCIITLGARKNYERTKERFLLSTILNQNEYWDNKKSA